MYQYSLDKNTSNSALEKTQKMQDLMDKFANIDKKYGDLKTPKDIDLGLVEKTYVKPTEQSVKESATNSLLDYKNSNINKINEEYQTAQNNLDKQIDSANTKKENQIIEISEDYDKAKREAHNDALKNGIARSSIANNASNKIENDKNNQIDFLTKKANENITSLNSQKQMLETQKQNALNSFDIAYAVKLQDKIDSINKNIAKEESEVLEYNNKIRKQIADFEKSQDNESFDRMTNLARLIGVYGSGALEDVKASEKYELAKEYFKDLTKDEAIDELQNNIVYREGLGAYYNKLLSYLKAK